MTAGQPRDGVLRFSVIDRFLKSGGWCMSLASPRGSGEAVLDAMCGECAQTIFEPELIAHLQKQGYFKANLG